jgi:hypothetical protein
MQFAANDGSTITPNVHSNASAYGTEFYPTHDPNSSLRINCATTSGRGSVEPPEAQQQFFFEDVAGQLWRTNSGTLDYPTQQNLLSEQHYNTLQPQAPDTFSQYPRLDNNPTDTEKQFTNSEMAPVNGEQYSYPPLEDMSEIHDTQPYMTTQERAFHQMANQRDFEQHHELQQDAHRYPSPTNGQPDPYNTQVAIDIVNEANRMEMVLAETKSESADPTSPGRSKPILKPEREITKDASGRFYCNWPGCTDPIKEFGRKCEWRYGRSILSF